MTLAQLLTHKSADQRQLGKKRAALHAELELERASLSDAVAGFRREEKPALPYWVDL